MSIVRIGLAETKDFAEGYDAIFGKKNVKPDEAKTETPSETAKQTESTETKLNTKS